VESCSLCNDVVKGSVTFDTSSTSAKDCVCPEEYFMNGQKTECLRVPRGVNETSFGQTLEDLRLKRGFWRTGSNSTDIRECLAEEACLGGANSSDYCRPSHRGPLCQLCEAGYSKEMNGLCQPCDSSSKDTVLTLVLLLFGLALFYLFYRFVLKPRVPTEMLKSLRTGVKIMFASYQIIVNIPTVVPNIIVPEDFEKVVQKMSFLTFDMFTIVSVRCWTETATFYVQLALATLLPLIACLFLVVLSLSCSSPERKVQLMTIALALTYLTFPTVSSTVMAFFPCDEMDNNNEWLRADYSISCLASSRIPMTAFALVMVLVYPIGVPLLYFCILYKNRERIKKPVDERAEDLSIVGYAFLFESYKPAFWWFELAETFRRLSLTGILAVVKPGTETQLFSGILLSLIAIVATAWFQPYQDGRDNVIAVSMNLQVALITLTALALKRSQEADTYSPEEAYDEKGMGILLIVYNVVLILVFIFYGWGEMTSGSRSADGLAAKVIKKRGSVKTLASKRGVTTATEEDDVGIEMKPRANSEFEAANPMAKERAGTLGKERKSSWASAVDEDGNEYWYDKTSGRTSWTKR